MQQVRYEVTEANTLRSRTLGCVAQELESLDLAQAGQRASDQARLDLVQQGSSRERSSSATCDEVTGFMCNHCAWGQAIQD
jgi:hypothetical protein